MRSATTKRTTRKTTATFLDPQWHEERDIWTVDTIDVLRDRLAHQPPGGRLVTPWAIASIDHSAAAPSVAAVVVRQVYSDPPEMPLFLRSLYRRFHD
jgi:hypothetical protein